MTSTDITAANIYQYLQAGDEGAGTIFEDEADNIDEDREKMKIYKNGYTTGYPVSTCDFFHEGDLAEPSDTDINSMLYIYGQDGFGGNNMNVNAWPHFEVAIPTTGGNNSLSNNTLFSNDTSFQELSNKLSNMTAESEEPIPPPPS